MPFFNIVGFFIGTYINSATKKKRLAALRKKHYGGSSRPDDYPPPGLGGMGGPQMSSQGLGGSNPPY